MLTSLGRLCPLCCLAEAAQAAATAGFSIQGREIPRETDCPLEGDGFELSVPRDSDDGFSLELSGPTPFGERPTVRIPLGPPQNVPYQCGAEDFHRDVAVTSEAMVKRGRRGLVASNLTSASRRAG